VRRFTSVLLSMACNDHVRRSNLRLWPFFN
jgi:hypothetical protein